MIGENPVPIWQCYQINIIVKLLSNSYSTVPGIYGSKQTESEGAAGGQGLFINSRKSMATCAITTVYPT